VSIREEGSVAYPYTHLINKCSAALTDPPWDYSVGQLMRQA